MYHKDKVRQNLFHPQGKLISMFLRVTTSAEATVVRRHPGGANPFSIALSRKGAKCAKAQIRIRNDLCVFV